MAKPKWSVVSAVPRDDYSIELEFADGTRGVYDARPLIGRKPFALLGKLPFFMLAHADHGTVVWNDEVDIAPEHLYERCVPLARAGQ